MMYWKTIATDNDDFRIVKLGGMVWLEISDVNNCIGADNTNWIKTLYEHLSHGSLYTDHVKEFKEMLIEAGLNDGTQELLQACDILSTANEKGWLE